MNKSLVLIFGLQRKNDIHYARYITIRSWPRKIKTLRCRLPDDSEICTFDGLDKKFKNKIFNVKNPFCFFLVNSESKMEEKFCIKFNKDLPEYEDIIREKPLRFNISDQLKKLGY